MKKFWLIAVLVLVGCNVPQSSTGEDNSATNPEDEAVVEEQSEFSGPLMAAINLGIPMKCSYSVEGSEVEGYIQGKMYAGKMVTAGQVGNVIIKDECMWVWEEGVTQGVKSCFTPTETEESIWDDPESVDPTIEYRCVPTVLDEGRFTPPSEVEFTDLSEMMPGIVSPQAEE